MTSPLRPWRLPTALTICASAAFLAGACGEQPDAAVASADTTAVAAPSEHAHAAEGEGEALLPIMQKLGTYMTQLTHGLMTDDQAMVARNAASIATHAPITRADLERIHGILGERMAEFERLDEEVHASSVRLQEAAEAGGTADVLTRLNEVQRGCIACHVQFRERLRTAPAR